MEFGDLIECRTPVILLAEDEDTVMSFMRRLLEADGYAVMCARSAREAIVIASAYRGIIDVLLTDVWMGGADEGIALADTFARVRPESEILFTSGSCLPEARRKEWEGRHFLPKPFDPEKLLTVVGNLAATVPERAARASLV